VKVDDVQAMKPLDRFLYWVFERHQIFLRRLAGRPAPWTDDEVLQRVFFTNPFRENDKTTVWFRDHVRKPLRNDPQVLMATVIFRWFNYIPTGVLLLHHGLLEVWDHSRAVELLLKRWDNGRGQVFTGAYMIKAGNGPRGCKIPNVCHAITKVAAEVPRLLDVVDHDCRLEALWRELKKFPYLGPFMSYEVVCDLRYTYLLEAATDAYTWASPGPGAKRGLIRLRGEEPKFSKSGRMRAYSNQKVDLSQMVTLLGRLRRLKLAGAPDVDMRTVEHSLCEWDKYERALWNQGRLKRGYDATGQNAPSQV
jgi:hypothetical protein